MPFPIAQHRARAMYAFIDTETTGVSTRDRIVSVAWIIADNPEKPAVCKHSIVRPEGFTIPESAARIHGITTERAFAEGQPIAAVLTEFAADLAALRPQAVVAHNAHFDRRMLASEFQVLGLADPCEGLPFVCTVRRSRARWPGESASLGVVYERVFGTALRDAHDAGADAWACAQIFFHLQSPGCAPSTARPSPFPASERAAGALVQGHEDWGSLVRAVLAWAERKAGFDTGFVASLHERIACGGVLTVGQKSGLRNIIARYNIPV